MIHTPQILMPNDFSRKLQADINAAKRAIHLQAMDFSKGGEMDAVLYALKHSAAPDRSIAFDWNSYLPMPFGILKTVADLENADISVVNVGHPFIGIPISRRCHIKLHVIDDITYMGGINLAEDSFRNIDIMLRFEDSKLAQIARQIQIRTHTRKASDDFVIDIDKQNQLFVDGGKYGISCIANEAAEIVSNARKVWYLSQFAPTPEITRTILKCKTRVVKFNTVLSQGSMPAKIISGIDRHTTSVQNQYEGARKIHAKILITENRSGTKTVLAGSHNYALSGVLFGTRELALKSTDQKLANDLIGLVQQA